MMALAYHEDTSQLARVFKATKADQAQQAILNDRLIVKFGNQLISKHGYDKSRDNLVRNILCELGRLKLCLIKGWTLKNLEDFFIPAEFDSLLAAAKTVAGFDETPLGYSTPSLILKLSASIRKCVKIARCGAKMSSDHNKRREFEYYEKLLDIRGGVCQPTLSELYSNRR